MNTAVSKNKHKVRLTSERWLHISEGHPELAGYYFTVLESIENPDYVYRGNNEELLAVKIIAESKFLITIYKELDENDGFVITSFLSSKINYLKNKTLLWEKMK